MTLIFIYYIVITTFIRLNIHENEIGNFIPSNKNWGCELLIQHLEEICYQFL